MVPLHDTLCTSPGTAAVGVHVLMVAPSAPRTRSTVTLAGADSLIRYENVTAWCAPTNAFVRLVPVSIIGAPATRGPGTGESSVFGSGGGGGRIGIGFDGAELTSSPVIADTGPLTAPIGTRASRRVSLPGRTLTATSSLLP